MTHRKNCRRAKIAYSTNGLPIDWTADRFLADKSNTKAAGPKGSRMKCVSGTIVWEQSGLIAQNHLVPKLRKSGKFVGRAS